MGISSTSFKPGKKGGPGRPKGSPNRFKLQTVREFFKDKEINPIKSTWEMIERVKDPATKASLMLRLLAWIEPRPTKVEIDAIEAKSQIEENDTVNKLSVRELLVALDENGNKEDKKDQIKAP